MLSPFNNFMKFVFDDAENPDGEIAMEVLIKGKKFHDVGTMSDYTLAIRKNEGENKPHFHVINNKMDTCVRLDQSAYFEHGYHKGKLNNDERGDLLKLLTRFNKKYNKVNWEVLRDWWVDAYGDKVITKNSKMPNYRNLPHK